MRIIKLNLLALLVLLATSVACAQRGPAYDDEIEVATQPQAETVQVKSAKMGRNIPVVVTVPEQYFDADLQEELFPVVYLLHGADGDCNNWPNKADLDGLASDFGVIIVCPDGQDSWYFDSPIDPKFQFETFVAQELVDYVDHHYRTFRDKDMRAITGLSMGGHGALWLAFRHPDVFGACGSMSGGVDITQFPDRWKIDQRLGPWAANKQRWADHAVINLVPSVKPGQHIIIDDGYSDIFYKVNLALHEALMQHKIPHEFTVRPGAHTWDYWVSALDHHMLFFSKAFAEASEKMTTEN